MFLARRGFCILQAESLRDSDCHGFLCRPLSKFAEWKAMYDERLWVLNRLLGRPIYPGLEELRLYENKRLSAYWLQHRGKPHPKTRVFYRKAEYWTSCPAGPSCPS